MLIKIVQLYMHRKQKSASEKVTIKAMVKVGIEPRLFATTFVKGGVQNTTVVYPWFWQECN